MTKYITEAVFNGTKLRLAVPGSSVDNVMKHLRKDKTVKNASVFVFYSRKTGKLINARMN